MDIKRSRGLPSLSPNNAVHWLQHSWLLSRTLVLHRHFAPALSPSSLVLLRGQAGPAPYTALTLFSLLFPSSPTFLSSASAPAVALYCATPVTSTSISRKRDQNELAP